MRVQALYNEYKESVQKILKISKTAAVISFIIPMVIYRAASIMVDQDGIDFGQRLIYQGQDITNSSPDDAHSNIDWSDVASNATVSNGGSIQRVIPSSASQRLNDYWNEYRDLVMELDRDEDDEIIGEPMLDIIFNQINELTERISIEFPGVQIPQWLHALIHARPNTISAQSVNVETENIF